MKKNKRTNKSTDNDVLINKAEIVDAGEKISADVDLPGSERTTATEFNGKTVVDAAPENDAEVRQKNDNGISDEPQNIAIEPLKDDELSLAQMRKNDLAKAADFEEKRKKSRLGRFWPNRFKIWSRRYGSIFGKKLALISVILFILVAISLLPQFYVKKISVIGARNIDPKAIVANSDLHIQQHLFNGLGGSLEGWLRLRYTSAEKRIKKLFPNIENIEIKLDFPGQLKFIVTERIGVAYIKMPDYVIVVDKDGVVLRIDDKAPDKVPLIVGVDEEWVEAGHAINERLRNSITNSVLLMSTIIDADREAGDAWNFFSRLVNMRPINSHSHYITIRLNNDKELIVKLGKPSSLQEDIFWLRSAVKMGIFEHLNEGLLDMSGNQRIYAPEDHFMATIDLTYAKYRGIPIPRNLKEVVESQVADKDKDGTDKAKPKSSGEASKNKAEVEESKKAENQATNQEKSANAESVEGGKAKETAETAVGNSTKVTNSSAGGNKNNNSDNAGDNKANETFPHNDFTNPTAIINRRNNN